MRQTARLQGELYGGGAPTEKGMRMKVWTKAVVLWGCGTTALWGAMGWRGDGTGSYPDATPPKTWGRDLRVAWRVPIPQWSNASPVHQDGRVVVCAEPATVLCYALADGKLLWQAEQDYADVATTPADADAARAARKALAELEPGLRQAEDAVRKAKGALKKTPDDGAAKQALADAEKARDAAKAQLGPHEKYRFPAAHDVTGLTSPTPITDGKHFYVLFGSGTLAAYSLDGQRAWGREVGRPKHGWGHSASPVLAGDTLVVHIGDRLLGLDPATGAERWQASSPSGWGTPAVAKTPERWLVLTPAGDWFDAADGRKTAGKAQPFQWNGPVVVGGVSYQMDEQGASAVAIDADGTPRPLWQASVPKDRYYASPVVHDGLVYGINQKGRLTVLSAVDGSPVYQQDVDFGRGGKTVYPSPYYADGHVHLSADNGTTVVIATGKAYQEVGRNELTGFRSTPLCVGKRLLIRTQNDLTCFE
jgi:hypothetical protein